MFGAKLLACAALLVGVSGRTLVEEYNPHYYFLEDVVHDEPAPITEEAMIPIHAGRQRRQIHGSFAANSDGTSNLNMKVPLAGNDKNTLSAIGGLGLRNQHFASGTAGLALDNVNGHGLSLTKTFIPGVGDRVAAAGQLNLFHNDNHNLAANAFAARTTLNNPTVPSFNTVGGGLDYMFKNKVGAGLSVARTPLFDKTDYSATGNLNLFRNRDTSLDFKAGFTKTLSPFMPSRSWEPNALFTVTKYF